MLILVDWPRVGPEENPDEMLNYSCPPNPATKIGEFNSATAPSKLTMT